MHLHNIEFAKDFFPRGERVSEEMIKFYDCKVFSALCSCGLKIALIWMRLNSNLASHFKNVVNLVEKITLAGLNNFLLLQVS